jgi:hypothetical protein
MDGRRGGSNLEHRAVKAQQNRTPSFFRLSS